MPVIIFHSTRWHLQISSFKSQHKINTVNTLWTFQDDVLKPFHVSVLLFSLSVFSFWKIANVTNLTDIQGLNERVNTC